MSSRDLTKTALRGEPSYLWRAGQERRLNMILTAAGSHLKGRMLENGCGVGTYLEHLAPYAGSIIGLEYDWDRTRSAHARASSLVNASSEELPFTDGSYDVILSHEVLEHVSDDHRSVTEMVRVLKPGGIIVFFVPNRGYPFETHGIYWRGRYHFGNIPFVHYLPSRWRQRLTPHVRAYSRSDVEQLFVNLPIRILDQKIIFGAYDNIIYRSPALGRLLRAVLHWLERTPFKIFGLSHFWVIQRD